MYTSKKVCLFLYLQMGQMSKNVTNIMNCNGLFCKNTWPAITDIPVTVCLCLAWYVKKANINISHKHYDHPKVLCHCCINLQLSSNKLTLAKYVCLSNVALAHRPTTALISEL